MHVKSIISIGVALAALASAPALAYSTSPMPRDAHSGANLADPDAAFDRQADNYQNGRWGSDAMMVGERAHEREATQSRDRTTGDWFGGARDYSCVDCSSTLVDGLWLLNHDQSSEDENSQR